MKIVIGSDHAAFEMKEILKGFLQSKKFEVIDVGTYSLERADYPDYARKVCHEVMTQNIEGVLICGSGIGVSMAANRFKGIRAALCRGPLDAEMARKHNNANVICLGARFNTEEEIKTILESWFSHTFEGGRHAERLAKFEDSGESC
jgi:ribose 5-phosphate isomerase B